MDIDTFTDLIDEFDGEYLKFERVEDKKSEWQDLHALILLNKIFPKKDRRGRFIAAAEHDEIWFQVDDRDIEASTITREQVLELVRCGVRWDDDVSSLAMFV